MRELEARPEYGSNIPEARNQLRAISKDLRDQGLKNIAYRIDRIVEDKMTRKTCGRRAPNKNPPVTLKQVNHIKNLLAFTNMSQVAIAQTVCVNPGRVSEIANDLRDSKGNVK